MKRFIITEERLVALLQAEDHLQALEAAGVDNWDGCSYAFDDLDKTLLDAESVPDYLIGHDIREL